MKKHRFLASATGMFAAVVLMFSGGANSASSFVKYSPSNPDYPQKVDFVAKCFVTHTLPDDPILYPNTPGAAHNHTFGATAANAYSTADSLARTATNCTMTRDHAAYWQPTIYNDGVPVLPYEMRAYYRIGTFDATQIRPIPFGLKMIVGNAMATTAQTDGTTGFQCRNLKVGNTVPRQTTPPICPVGDFLESSVWFNNCWDGVNLWKADRSHMSYASPTEKCDAAHPVRLPRLVLAMRFPTNALRGTITLATMAGMTPNKYSLHADFINAWQPETMAALVKYCLHASIACETVSNSRLPPGMVLPADTPPPTTVG